jgi:hypothetical protein
MFRRLIELLVLHAKERKAIRTLSRNEWSTDFLVYLLKKSSIKGLTIRIRNKDGMVMELINEYTPAVTDIYASEMAFNQDEIDALMEAM